jgi:hypothetical protein
MVKTINYYSRNISFFYLKGNVVNDRPFLFGTRRPKTDWRSICGNTPTTSGIGGDMHGNMEMATGPAQAEASDEVLVGCGLY